MYLNAHIRVYINGQLIKNISSISIKNDSQHLGSNCEIIMPLNTRILYAAQKKDSAGNPTGTVEMLAQPPSNIFNTGDTISVRAKYDGYENAYIHFVDSFNKAPDWIDKDGYLILFEGYLYDFYQGSPLKLKCLDAIYLANQGTFTKSYPVVPLKQLLTDIVTGTELSIMELKPKYLNSENIEDDNSLFDLTLENITFKDMSPSACLEWLRKEIGINISLQGKKVYYNIASNTLDTVKLSTAVNVLKSNLETTNLTKGSKAAGSTFQKYKVKAWFLQKDGTKDSIEVGDSDGQLREVFFYKILRKATNDLTIANYTALAKQALTKVRQSRFNGTIDTLLYPYCDIFWRVIYTDISYPARNGQYVVTSKEYKINESGYRQTLKLAYLGDELNVNQLI
jgi:hypothetical protein